jgi:2EXR family
MASDTQLAAATSFTMFSKLPEELRYMIWAHAAPLRPRVIQVYYETTTKTWQAHKDSCGGLPPVIHVSREARREALKGYTSAFDTWVDLVEDTIFICDPVFTIQKPRKRFIKTKYVNRLRKVAITTEIYEALQFSADEFPTLCPRPTGVLRGLKGLTHFILVLSDNMDQDVFNSDDTGISEDGHDTGDEDHESGEEADGDNQIDRVSPIDSATAADELARRLRRSLRYFEKNALAEMSKGFLQHPGNIHFESAMDSVDYWDDGDYYKDLITVQYESEKVSWPEWVRPKVSIMVLKYGLKWLGDFTWPIHLSGDHCDVELENSEFPPDDSSSESADDLHYCFTVAAMEEEEEYGEENPDEAL